MHLDYEAECSCACRGPSLSSCKLSWAPFCGNPTCFQSMSRSAPSEQRIHILLLVFLTHFFCCNQRPITFLHIFSCVPEHQILVTLKGSPRLQSVTSLQVNQKRFYWLPHPSQEVHSIFPSPGHLYCTWRSSRAIFRLLVKRIVFSWKSGMQTKHYVFLVFFSLACLVFWLWLLL